eukprot:CAMPEP_0196577422 /NCGR_PEP_ID=MMETSP1081-20130531/6493_1 /TAXON_ID=36882 /ORGANISM="Pyramimonas amylifera, Strain CCMP720" /LENGTH=96 /DNA_ID=CAMNT_0041896345 /DNA_START=109 /DNA_END=395 /DNA_ORIENTATION=+
MPWGFTLGDILQQPLHPHLPRRKEGKQGQELLVHDMGSWTPHQPLPKPAKGRNENLLPNFLSRTWNMASLLQEPPAKSESPRTNRDFPSFQCVEMP